jgi:CHAT domain-containing protein
MSYGVLKLFSCHGTFDVDNVSESRLGCSGGEAVTAGDIISLDLKDTKVVVLSACETGLTNPRDITYEYDGLPSAFLAAGAHSVIASLLSVNDFTTSILTVRFHENLRDKKMSKAGSRREAQIWLREATSDEIIRWLESHSLGDDHSSDWLAEGNVHAAINWLRHGSKSLASNPFSDPFWSAAFQCIGSGWNLSTVTPSEPSRTVSEVASGDRSSKTLRQTMSAKAQGRFQKIVTSILRWSKLGS